MYAEDSFFTLTVPGQIGLAALSAVMAGISIWVCHKLSRGRSWISRILIAALIYFLFIWLAPQIYYTYYIFLLEGLPWQVVVQTPPTPVSLARLMMFQENQNLSFHAQGLLGWVLLAVAVWAGRRPG